MTVNKIPAATVTAISSKLKVEIPEAPLPPSTAKPEVKVTYSLEKKTLKQRWQQSSIKRWLELHIWYALWYKNLKLAIPDIIKNMFISLFNAFGLFLILLLFNIIQASLLAYICTVALYFFIQEVPAFVRRTFK